MKEDIFHISDTAYWIAGFRAQETQRSDAAFKDALAEKLAGERGMQMVATTPYMKAMAFAMVVRTVAIDRLLHSAISNGITTVINLGAGLDTRPYRLELPPGLQWIEVDLPGVIAYKNEKLKTDKPVCRLERISCDLSNEIERKNLFSELDKKSNNSLVLTEGLIGYLSVEEAASLSRDILDTPSFRFWAMDYSRGKYRTTRATKKLAKKLKNTPIRFKHPEPLQFFSRHGWTIKENLSILDEARRIKRRLPLMFPWNTLMFLFPQKMYRIGNATYGYVMFAK
ncbi:MAG TPA: class I SAM-dependent methyltransferase [Chitinophagaceae bacterium]|nr:class I SAM-dependent methyltransferase [Chitinophagaceae bacterium]